MIIQDQLLSAITHAYWISTRALLSNPEPPPSQKPTYGPSQISNNSGCETVILSRELLSQIRQLEVFFETGRGQFDYDLENQEIANSEYLFEIICVKKYL